MKNKKQLFMGIILAVLLAVTPIAMFSPFLIILSGILLAICIITVFAPEDFKFLLTIFLAGFLLRVFLASMFYHASFFVRNGINPGFIFSNDGWCYSEQGWQICKFMERGIKVTKETFLADPNMVVAFGARSGNITSYDFFAAFVYSIIGKSPLSLFFISSIAGSVTGLFVYLTAKELFSRQVARISAILVLFWPSFILWSTQNLKDPAISLFIVIILWAIVHITRRPLPWFPLLFLPAAISTLMLYKISPPFALIVCAGIMFSGLFLFIMHLFKNKLVVFTAIGIVLVIILISFNDLIFSLIVHRTGFNSIFEYLNYNRSVRAYGNLSYLEDFSISSPGKTIVFLPLGLIYALFAPFPWQVGSFMQIVAVPETLIFYFLFPFTLKGVVSAYKKNSSQILMILMIIAMIICFLAVIEGNSGTLFRHRSAAFVLLFMFTAFGISLKKKQEEGI